MLQGLENPFMQVTIHGNKRRQSLIVGNLDPNSQGAPQYFAKLENNPAIFTVLARPFDILREAQSPPRAQLHELRPKQAIHHQHIRKWPQDTATKTRNWRKRLASP